MSELMLVNPRRRRKSRTAAQKAATRKLVALNRRRKSPTRRRKTVSKRRRNPIASRRRPTVRRRNPIRRPSMKRGIINNTLMPALINAVGALGLDVAVGVIPLPAFAQTGAIRYVVKGAGAIGIGILAGFFTKKSTAHQLAMGAMTVTMHDALKEVTQRMAPGVPLGYYGNGMNAGSAPAGLTDSMPGMGYYVSDAPVVENAETRESTMSEYV